MVDNEVFEVEKVETHELIEVKKKGRKPMSDERKAQLKEQLRLAREKKKAMKEAGTLPKKDPKESKLIKVLDQVGGDPVAEPLPPVYVKNMRKSTKDHSKDIAELKEQIAELKAHNSKSDKEELKQLREEMKKIKEEKKQQAKKVAEYKKPPPKAPQPKAKGLDVAEAVPAPRVVPTARYSTYQKSIWSKFL